MNHFAPARGWLVVLTLTYVVIGGFCVLWPEPSLPTRVVSEVQRTLLDFGGDRGEVRRGAVEVAMNVALALPAPVLASRWLPTVSWWRWLPVGAAASACVELFQLLVAPGTRSPSLRDVGANTAGVVLGCLVVAGQQRRRATTYDAAR